MLELVIFDVDGLMIDSERIWMEALESVGKEYGFCGLGSKLYSQIVGKSGNEEKRVFEQYFDKDFVDPFIKRWEQIGFSNLEKNIPVKKGLFELIEYLKKQNIKLAVATTTKRKLTLERLSKIGVYKYFDCILCGDEVTKKKPNPEIYETVLNHFGVSCLNALVLEDSVVGVEAAYRANIPCIQVPDLFPPTEVQEIQTIQILGDLLEVKEYIHKNMIQSSR